MSVEETLYSYMGPGERGGSGNIKYRCPFHGGGNEKSASFYVHATSGWAFCHACNQGWSFPTLLQLLGADWRVISAASAMLEDTPRKRRTPAYLGLHKDALLPESLTAATLRCPEDLLAAGYDMNLLLENEVGYDEYNQCALYHLRDHMGRLAGVSGRWSDGYYVYGRHQLLSFAEPSVVTGYQRPEKSLFLWNLHRVYPRRFHTGEEGPVIVVEGFKACIWCQAAGFRDVVALMGSYLSDSQQILLERITNDIILFLDDDKAGHKGTDRAITALRNSCRVKVVRYPEHDRPKLQPDDLPLDVVREVVTTAPYYYQRNQ